LRLPALLILANKVQEGEKWSEAQKSQNPKATSPFSSNPAFAASGTTRNGGFP
jgi:hypothetical protein